MIGDYTIYERSMNGIKTLSDGISYITDGNATHNNITYTDYLQSADEITLLTNDTITTDTINCDAFNATSINVGNLDATTIECDRFYVVDASANKIVDFNGATNNLAFNGISNFNNTLNVTNKNIVQTQNGRISQSGTATNDLKDTNINGFLTIGSNITQNGGSASLKDITTDNLTLRSNKSITQTGTSVSNTLAGTTTIKDLIILDSVVFPSSVTVPGTTTTDDIVMEGDSVIIQDLTTTTTKQNIFRNTKALDLQIDGNLSQIKGGATATLKNTTIQGTAEIQGDITQTTGASSLRTINCNNITLRDDQNITQSGTGYITQSGSGTNTMKAIDLTNNSNLTFYGNGIISQPLNTSQNILNNFRCAGYGIVGGRNNTTYSNSENTVNNVGLQLQFNRDNSTQYSFIMNNKGAGSNGGGFRFQRYVGGLYLDEPMVIDSNITMNKNLSIPGGSISCASATLGNISQVELNKLEGCTYNIENEFNLINEDIIALQQTTSGTSVALTGISYVSATDTTLIENNLTLSSGKNLMVGTTNIISSISSLNITTSGISYNSVSDTTTIDNNLTISSGKNLLIGTTNVVSSINSLNSVTYGMTYNLIADTTTIDNNVTINKTLIVQGMDIKAEIDALDTSFTTGTINSTDLTTSNLNVNNNSRFGQVGGSTFVKNDMRFCNTVNKSESECTQFYQSGSTMNIQNQTTNGGISIQAKNSSGVMTEYMSINSTSLNVKGTNVDIDTNLNVDGTTTLNDLTMNGVITTNDSIIAGGFISYVNTAPSSVTQTKTSGAVTNTPYVYSTLIFSITFNGSEKKNIQITSPLSYARSSIIGTQGVGISNTIVTTISQISIVVKKNGTVVSTFSPSFSESFVRTIKANKTTSSTGQTYTYEIFFGYISFSYQIDSYNPDTYEFYAQTTLSSAYDSEESVYSLVNTNTNVTTFTKNAYISSVEFYSTNYASPSYQLLNPSYKSETGLLLTNEIISNNIYNQYYLQTNTMAALGSIIMRNNVAAYMVRLFSARTLMYPIPCSMKDIEPFNVDNSWIVYPGFKIVIYDDANYANELQTISNDGTTDGYVNKPICVAATNINRCGSVRVYFRATTSIAYEEITLPNIS